MINEDDIKARDIVLNFLDTLQKIASGVLKTNKFGMEIVNEGKRDAAAAGGGGGGGGRGDESRIVKSPRKAKRRLLSTLQNDDNIDQAFVRTFRSVTSLFIQ